MDYNAFNRLDRNEIAAMDAAQKQTYMEQVIRAACRPDIEHPRILDRMAPEFVSCDAEGQSAVIRFAVQDWMCNVKGTLHGGMFAAMMDNAMGLLTRAFYGNGDAVSTINLNVNYLRPVLPGGYVTVKVEAEKLGRHVAFLRAKLFTQEGKPAAAATGVFNV